MKILFATFLFSISLLSYSQNYVSGNVYYGTDSLIEYRCGNLPIILSSPHGGYETPATLPDRNCTGCVTGRDSYTQELTRQIEAAILFKTGCYPHVIINRLHRKKLDANRAMIEATDSNLATELYWHEYMNFVDSAKNLIYKKYSKGIFFDIHGHGHAIQRLELGYLLSGTDLRKSDSLIDSSPLNTKTSILSLRYSNLNSYSHSQLIRGPHSFGAMIQKRGVPAVPSDSIPFPLVGESYFNGGYNTVRFGSRNGGTIDAIQIESHQGVRFDYNKRVEYADSLAEAILEYVEKHYFVDFSQTYCNTVTLKERNSLGYISVFPNPTTGLIYLKGISPDTRIDLFSMDGKLINSFNYAKKINLSSLKSGIYFLRISSRTKVNTLRIIKN
jgi:N-formylglutamate amidohydrolase